ncbi:MAG: hypothetical protein RL748_2609 [Pseudomonadota bacterium]|jgi:hypothetical protein
MSSPTVKQIAQEYPPANEKADSEELAQRLIAKINADYPDGLMRRDAHPKMHGLVKAEFIIEPDLPPELAVGLFKHAKTYPAWIRFSNQNGTPQSDAKGDIRGMAIKLMGVPGEKLMEESPHASTHDFLLISAPVLVTADIAEFLKLVKALTGNIVSMGWFFATHLRATYNLLSAMKKASNPLHLRYWSTTPYLFGAGRAVKYSALPLVTVADPVPTNGSDNLLREAMVKHLAKNGASFDFCVQFQLDADKMPIEDAGMLWDEKESPFHKVATIRIAPQQFNNAARDQYGENLSFIPWHALAEHRPLGGVNRGRKIVYQAVSKFRHARNTAPRVEPDDYEID